MRRAQLEHLLRAASTISGERDVVVIGSQSVLASHPDDALPPEATGSIEADVAFLTDPDDVKADLVDGAIGELSAFHERFGYYAQGVSTTTAVLPAGWQDRLIPLDSADTSPGRGLCLEPHDCVIAKLLAGRPKDHTFAAALRGLTLVRGHAESRIVRGKRDDREHGPQELLRGVPQAGRRLVRVHPWGNGPLDR